MALRREQRPRLGVAEMQGRHAGRLYPLCLVYAEKPIFSCKADQEGRSEVPSLMMTNPTVTL